MQGSGFQNQSDRIPVYVRDAMGLIEASLGELVTLVVIAVVIAAVTIAASRKSPKTGGTDTAEDTKEGPFDTR